MGFTRINEPNCFNQYNRLLFIVLGIIWLVHPKLNKLRPIDLLTLDDFEISVDNKNIDIKTML